MGAAYHILIVDDDDLVRHVIVRVVMGMYPTATISEGADGRDALLVYTQRGADLVVTDQDMPWFNGFALVAALRQLQQATIPILMLSADHTLEAHARAVGVTQFLPKPCPLAQLRQALTQLLPQVEG